MSRRDAYSGDLFAVPKAAAPVPGSMDFRPVVSHLVGEMLKDAHAAGHDRWAVASAASRLAGKDVSKLMLDGYTAQSRDEFNLPLWLTPVLETVCSSTRLTGWLASVRGGQLKVGVETLDAEIGRLTAEADQVSSHLRKLKDLRRRVRT